MTSHPAVSLAIALLALAGPALADPAPTLGDPASPALQIVVPGYLVEELAALPDTPTSLATPPPGSSFPGGLFVGSRVASTCTEGSTEDRVYRIQADGSVELFASLLCEADPVSLAFAPIGSPFGDELYVSANNRDMNGFDTADCGGTIQRVAADGSWVDFTAPEGGMSVFGCTTTTPLLEPTDIDFGSGGFGAGMYVANSTNPPVSIHTVSSAGAVGNFTTATDSEAPATLAFGLGGAFGSDLYLGKLFDPDVDVIGSDGVASTFASLPLLLGVWTIEFGRGDFGDRLYVVGRDNSDIWTIEPDGTVDLFATGSTAQFYDALHFTDDGSTMYVADSGTGSIYRITAAPSGPAQEVVRLGAPPNPSALLPGQTSGPILGQVWDPLVDHTSFAAASLLDVLVIAGAPANVPLGGLGTLLCDLTGSPVTTTATPGSAFAVPVPASPGLVGNTLCAQAASFEPAGPLLTNALDLVIGSF